MTQIEALFAINQTSFPSNEFLRRYFGDDQILENRGEASIELYARLRQIFDGVLRFLPGIMMKRMNRAGAGFTRIYVFKDGRPAEWVDPNLETWGLVTELPLEGHLALCREFITLFENGGMGTHEWFLWQRESDSIWVEVIPEAIKAGKNRQRSLAEIFKDKDASE